MGIEPREYIAQYKREKDNRSPWENTWQKVSDYVSPVPNDIITTVNQQTNGGRKRAIVLDTTATECCVQLAHALNGAWSNPNSDWFKHTVNNYNVSNDKEARDWLETVADVVNHHLQQSNFSEAMIEAYQDLTMYGTVGLLVEEDEEDGVRFSASNVGEFVGLTNHKNHIDKVLRKPRMTAREAFMRWGNAVGKSIIKQYEIDPSKYVEILHVIEPRNDRDTRKIDKKNKPIRSVWIGCEDENVIEESGFEESAFIVARWSKVAGETYGYSPSMQCLSAILSLNLIEKTSLEAKQLQALPVVVVDDDSLLSQFQFRPGATIFKRKNSNPPTVLNTNANANAADSAANDRREMIRKTFFADVIVNQNTQYVTAEGVRQNADERERILSSLMWRLQSELFEPMHNRSNCSPGWRISGSGDDEVTPDEIADGIQCGLSVQTCRAGDGAVTGMDLCAPI